jgi:putative Mg2+ transporter-C (MgtC) family protein
MALSVVDLLSRLAVAGLLAAAIGVEREARRHPAGVRTHALVAVGACLFTTTGAYGFTDAADATADPTRIAAQVAAGIGFIGAGAILRTSGSVRGLTTAATLWFTAAMGVTVGAGGYVAALISAGVVFAVLIGLRVVKRWLPGHKHTVVEVEYTRGHGTIGPILRDLERMSSVQNVTIDDDDPDALTNGVRRVVVQLAVNDEAELAHVCERLGRRPEVQSVFVWRQAKANDRA